MGLQKGMYSVGDDKYIILCGSSEQSTRTNIMIYGKNHSTYPNYIQFRMGNDPKIYITGGGVLKFTKENGAVLYQPMLNYSASGAKDKLIINHAPASSVEAADWTRVKEIRLARSGTVYIKYQHHTFGDGTPTTGARSRIYRNGSPVGTEHVYMSTTPTTFSESISGWSPNDLCQIYTKGTGDEKVGILNFEIYSDYVQTEAVTYAAGS